MGACCGGSEVRRREHIWLRPFKFLLTGMLAVALTATTALGNETAPQAVIERLHGTLLEVMQAADELGYQGRYDRLAPVLHESYDFAFMTRIAVGSAWRELDQAEQARLTDLFAEMSIAHYAARFDGFGGEHFETIGEGPGPRDAIVVQSRLVRPQDEPVGLDYVLRQGDDAWRIIDVLLEAKFSELARQKADFAAVLRAGGVANLVATLEQKIEELAGDS